RAHPYRYLAHNGEINTLRGNINWMHARQTMFESELFGDDIKKILPIINTDGSDSAMFDNCLELLALGGRSLPHAVMMMIPEPWAVHGRLQPGRMFRVGTEEGRIVADGELKTRFARAHPYQEWLDKNHVLLENLPEPPHVHEPDHKTVLQRQQGFGYTFEDL